MKKLICTVIVSILLTQLFQYTVYADSSFVNKSSKDEITILIDPGHGGMDGGAETKDGIIEKDINLKISMKLRDRLKKQGYKVFMTRNTDKGLYGSEGKIRKKKIEDLNNRVKLKKDTHCDMFVSIHLNMFPQSKYYGAQVWYSKNDESKKLARIVQNNLIQDLDRNNNRREKAASNLYKILRENDTMPSIIVECGFLSNYEEKQKLISDSYQEKIAVSLSKSINEYYENLNK
ncbi:N-acetylmuramoyl-L-alanine amidase CwlD [Clostridium sp. cel8]|uniref:N-acetylmuramoyl-L-alanine amidase CwlD n=1 Tax=Clostridium sp. cel8 TaxID=2663123 RepID=UPI001FAE5C16|nr:N-acetylmuramoyl-L-alanine amidase CwlD [Clostridium sp. cel8]